MGLFWDLIDAAQESSEKHQAYDVILPQLLKALDEQDRPAARVRRGSEDFSAPTAQEDFSAPTAHSSNRMQSFQDAIASIESKGSGGYSAIGPRTRTGDQAYGRYQVMGANIPSWTRESLGAPLTPEQFLRSPRAQDAVFNTKFGSYVDKYGARDAASIWFTGRPLARGGASAQDVNRMTGDQYVSRFERALGPSGGMRLAGATPTPDTLSMADYDRVPTTPPDWEGTRENYVRSQLGRSVDKQTGTAAELAEAGREPIGIGGQASRSAPPLDPESQRRPSAVPPITQPIGTLPSGRRHPGFSNELIIQALQNPYTAAIAQTLLTQRFKHDQPTMQIVEIDVADDQGNYAGQRKALFDPHSGNPPVPFGPVNTSKARERAPTSVQEYEYETAHPGFREFRKRGTKEEGYEAEVAARLRTVIRQGDDPADPRQKQFINTGRYPREDTSPLTATDKKAILEADEMVMSGENAIKALDSAKEISKSTPGFYGAGTVGKLAAPFSQGAQSIVDLDNIVTGQAVESLRAMFGGMPTEGERKILIELQGASSLPDAARQKIYDRARALTERRTKFNRQRAEELRGGVFYTKPQGAAAPTEDTKRRLGPPKVGAVWGGFRFKGGDPADRASWERP